MSQLPANQFLFGASCAPYAKSMDWPESEWDNDFANMRSLNFNVVRIFAAWDRIEREEGAFDYAKQDYALELATRHGLKVILNFGGLFSSLCGLYPPSWLWKYPECSTRQSTSAAAAHPWAPGSGICSDTPVYRKKAFEFMERTVRRYAEYDTLFAWMIWNEPASYVCYCPHTQERFKNWLKEKYKGNLDELNRLWGTEYPLRFGCWAEVVAPAGAGVLNQWRDWLQFNQFRLYDDMRKIDSIVRENDPRNRPTTSNIVYYLAGMEGPVNAPQYGMDLGRVSQSMSLLGLSFYAVEHKYDVGTGALSAYKLSRLRSVSKEEKRRMIVLESGAGPNMAMATKAQHMVNFHQLLAHNVKGILLWNYRSRISDGQVALFNLMKWDGSVSRRAQYMADFSGMLQKHAGLLNEAVPERQAAILTLEEEQILMDGLCGLHRPSSYEEAHDGRVGAYKLLWDMHISADCLTECQLSELGQYRLLLLPMQEHMSQELADIIKDYVAAGGTVIAESPFAFRSTDNFLQYKAPAFGLDKVFGCHTNDREGRETAPDIVCSDGKAKVCFFWSEYALDGGEALARYDNGEAAAVVNKYGKGRAIIFGTEVFRQYMRDPQPVISALLKNEVMESAVQPVATVAGESENVEVSRLSCEAGILYFLINHSSEDRRFRLTLRDKGLEWREMVSERIIDMEKEIFLRGQETLAVFSKQA